MSQVDRVLALLRSQGETGLNTSALQELPTLDGGAPVLRLAARVCQLREQGYSISSRRESNGTSTYVLESGQGYGGGWSGAQATIPTRQPKPQPDKAAAPDHLVGEPERALSETKDSTRREQADPGSVPYPAASSREGVRSAAPAEAPLFDTSSFAERRSYEDAA